MISSVACSSKFEVEFHPLQFQTVGFDLRQVEDVADERHQIGSGTAEYFDVLPLLPVQIGLPQ